MRPDTNCPKSKRVPVDQRVPVTPGDVVLIPLENEQHAYARVLTSPLMAFYDTDPHATLSIEEVVGKPILFTICVNDTALTSGRWPVLGHLPLEAKLLEHPRFFIYDMIAKKLFITYDGSQRIPATFEECEGLERAAVWDPKYHVEGRLNDHFAGRPNATVESDKRRGRPCA